MIKRKKKEALPSKCGCKERVKAEIQIIDSPDTTMAEKGDALDRIRKLVS